MQNPERGISPARTSEIHQPSRQSHDWPRIAVYGAGAVGCYFGARLAEAGAPVTLIARPAHVAAIRSEGLRFESTGVTRNIAIEAVPDPDVVREADLVLFCVKTRDTGEGASMLAPLLRSNAVLVSLQNGVDNVPRIREAGIDALGAVVYVAASMPGPGHLLHAGRGDLVVGEYGGTEPSARAAGVAGTFDRAGVGCRLETDVRTELWIKLVMNCAFNAISALGSGATYGRMLAEPAIRELMREVISECVSVGRAERVGIPEAEAQFDAAMRLGEAMRTATSSTAQDIDLGRPTEIDSLNGYVARRARALGLQAPVNQALAALVGLLERRDH
jgi:2-dehydropantoate 2-reductase